MIEHRGRVQQDFEYQHGEHGRPSAATRAELDERRDQHFRRMETHPGRHVEVGIRVVHARQLTARGTAWKSTCWKYMARSRAATAAASASHGGSASGLSTPPSALGGERGETDRRHRKNEPQQRGIEDDEAEVRRPALQPERPSARRGARSSHSAIAASTAPKALRRSQGSCWTR